MMKLLAQLTCLLLISACSSERSLFVGIDPSSLKQGDREIFVNASEDFQAVIAGGKPMHAKFRGSHALPSSPASGIDVYEARGYQIRVIIDNPKGSKVVAYGPSLTFTMEFSHINTPLEFADVRAYSPGALGELLVEARDGL